MQIFAVSSFLLAHFFHSSIKPVMKWKCLSVLLDISCSGEKRGGSSESQQKALLPNSLPLWTRSAGFSRAPWLAETRGHVTWLTLWKCSFGALCVRKLTKFKHVCEDLSAFCAALGVLWDSKVHQLFYTKKQTAAYCHELIRGCFITGDHFSWRCQTSCSFTDLSCFDTFTQIHSVCMTSSSRWGQRMMDSMNAVEAESNMTAFELHMPRFKAGTKWVQPLIKDPGGHWLPAGEISFLLWVHACKTWQASDLMPLQVYHTCPTAAANQTSTPSHQLWERRGGEGQRCSALWDWPGWMNDISLVVSGSQGGEK